LAAAAKMESLLTKSTMTETISLCVCGRRSMGNGYRHAGLVTRQKIK